MAGTKQFVFHFVIKNCHFKRNNTPSYILQSRVSHFCIIFMNDFFIN